MNRRAILIASVAAALGLLAYILWDVFRTVPEAPRERTTGPVEAPPQPAPGAAAPAERRELSVAGRVVGPLLEPLEGVRVVCGEESAVTDAKGGFTFAKALRPRTVGVLLMRGDAEIARWDGLVAGDPLPPPAAELANEEEPPPASAYSLDEAMVPALPERLRWTFNLASALAPGGAAPGGAGARSPGEDWIRLDDALVEEWGNGVRLRVRGKTRLPDGAHVAASLYFDGLRAIASLEPALVASGAFVATMYSPGDARFYSGVFDLRASFNTVLESYGALEGWKQIRPEVDWESLTIEEVKRSVSCGDPADAREEDLAVQAYYSRAVGSARRLEHALKATLLSRSDEARIFNDGRGLGQRSLRLGPKGWFQGDFLDAEGRLDEVKWRKFLDVEWRPELRTLSSDHLARGQEKYMTASTLFSGLLDALLEESYGYSRFVVYPAFGLEPHANDFYADEERSADLVRLEKVVAAAFAGLERFQHLAE